MKDDNIKKLFSNTDIPPVDSDKKRQAIALAMSEFSQQQEEEITSKTKSHQKNTQGYSFIPRPIREFFSNNRQNTMMTFNNKFVYSGIATVSVAVIGTLLFQQSYQPSIDTRPIVLNENLSKQVPKPIATPILKEKKKFEELEQDFSIRSEIAAAEPASMPPTAKRKSALTSAGDTAVTSGLMSPTADDSYPVSTQNQGRDQFETIEANAIKQVIESPVSTFSIDVDTTSYSFVRRQLNQGVLPQKNAVRTEELVNYFDYAYPLPTSQSQPFEPSIVTYPSPWNKGKELIHIGIKGYDIAKSEQPKSNLILLLDVSGSMNSQDKLPLVKQSMHMLLNSLKPEDTIGIVVYAGAAGAVLEPTPVKEKQKILDALNRLSAGGSTAGAQGIKLAYQLAEANFDKKAVNRIMLATDGDFNVGLTSNEELKGFIERKRDQGIFLSVLGFGQGNYNDHLMQTLAQNGNGIAAYIDSLSEAQKVLIDQATSTLFPIAKDVKIQVEFNPNTVSEYRLVGYETRQLAREDFNNDKVDAGDIGAGHSVTAIYEITTKHSDAKPAIDPLRYNNEPSSKAIVHSQEYGFVKVRYKLPNENTSRLISKPISSLKNSPQVTLDNEVKFASAVAGFSQLLQGGEYINNYSYDDVIKAAQASKGEDEFGYRTEFIQLVRKAKIAAAMK